MAEHFPGEFGSEQLVQQVVDTIVAATEKKEEAQLVGGATDEMETESKKHVMYTCIHVHYTDKVSTLLLINSFLDDLLRDAPLPMMKTIITGMNKMKKVLHKEELGMSEAERSIKRKVDQKLKQMNTSSTSESTHKVSRKTSPSPSSNELTTTPTKVSQYVQVMLLIFLIRNLLIRALLLNLLLLLQ